MQRTARRILSWGPLLALAALVLAPADAEAIPAFARRYKLSCSTCHAPFPRLKEFGDEFAGNGFYIPEEERERDYVSGGDDLQHLNRTFPVAVRFDAYAYFEQDVAANAGANVNNDLQTPFGLKLLSGGPITRNVGYYFYFYMSEQGEVAGVEDAYVHFNDLGGVPFDILVGQFQVCDPLMKRELRLTYEDYQIYKHRVGDVGANLAYDRGILASYDVAATGTGLIGMVVNGNGKAAANEGAVEGKFDDDKYKNYAARISQSLFGVAQAGYFFYYGEERGSEDRMNRLRYHGPDVVLGNGTLDLTLQYLLREDTNPGFQYRARARDTKGVVGELVISPHGDRSRVYGTLLYNWIESDLGWSEAGRGDAPPAPATVYRTYTASLTYLFARNLRGTLEYTYDDVGDLSRGGIGLVTAF